MISFFVHFIRQHFLIILCCVITGFLWPNLRKHFVSDFGAFQRSETESDHTKLFTAKELALYDGVHKEKLFLAILGSVYDVTTGAKHYGPDGNYNYFVGKDASVAFITGDFEQQTAEDNKYDDDDVLKRLSAQEMYSIHQWKQFYDKDYRFVGLLIGRFYTANGHKTEYMAKVEQQIEIAMAEKDRLKMLRKHYPPCNIEWKAETGTRVWCSKQSGGIDRDFIGIPRKFFEVGQTDFRCACVPNDRLNDSLLNEYDDCDPKAVECVYKVD